MDLKLNFFILIVLKSTALFKCILAIFIEPDCERVNGERRRRSIAYFWAAASTHRPHAQKLASTRFSARRAIVLMGSVTVCFVILCVCVNACVRVFVCVCCAGVWCRLFVVAQARRLLAQASRFVREFLSFVIANLVRARGPIV